MLPQRSRLSVRQFDKAFSRSSPVRHPLMVLRVHDRSRGEEGTSHSQEEARAAFVVPKKQGKATYRNRVRRRLRECYRLHPARSSPALEGLDLLFFATPQTAEATHQELVLAMGEVLERAARRRRKPPAPPDEVGSSMEPRLAEEDTAAPENQGQGAELESLQGALPWTAAGLGLRAIRLYQRFISPSLPPSCRFYPTCSRYTYEAIARFGLWRGTLLGVCRVCRCHPWHPGGYDPVPTILSWGRWWGKPGPGENAVSRGKH